MKCIWIIKILPDVNSPEKKSQEITRVLFPYTVVLQGQAAEGDARNSTFKRYRKENVEKNSLEK